MFENLTAKQTYYLWLNEAYYKLDKTMITQCYQDISRSIYDQMYVIWGNLSLDEQREVQQILTLFNNMLDICKALHDSALEDKWLATVKI